MTYWLNTLFNLFNRLLDNLFENWYIAQHIGIGDLFLYSFIATLVIKFVFNIKVGSLWFSKDKNS